MVEVRSGLMREPEYCFEDCFCDGRLTALKALLAAGVDARAAPARALLFTATEEPAPRVVAELLAAGADATAFDPDPREDPYNTPLHAITERAYSTRVQADRAPHVASIAGALHAITDRRYSTRARADRAPLVASIAGALIAAGADVEARNSEGRTPLWLAMDAGWASSPALIEVLINSGGAKVEHAEACALWDEAAAEAAEPAGDPESGGPTTPALRAYAPQLALVRATPPELCPLSASH